tara:strand:- start:1255 stop:1437 length:183 start_codon:yes stop_codon:yes gene_type:complete
MINLHNHVVSIEGVEYVPFNIAQAAVAETYSDSKLDDVLNIIKQTVSDMDNSVKDALKDD